MESENNFTHTTTQESKMALPEEPIVQEMRTTSQSLLKIKEISPYKYLHWGLIFNIIGFGACSFSTSIPMILTVISVIFYLLAVVFAFLSIVQAFRSSKLKYRNYKLLSRILIIILALIIGGWGGCWGTLLLFEIF